MLIGDVRIGAGCLVGPGASLRGELQQVVAWSGGLAAIRSARLRGEFHRAVVAELLDSAGIAYIEGGWPGSNPKDVEFFEEAKKLEEEKKAPGCGGCGSSGGCGR